MYIYEYVEVQNTAYKTKAFRTIEKYIRVSTGRIDPAIGDICSANVLLKTPA